MTGARAAIGGHYYTGVSVPVSQAMLESATRAASHTGKIQMVHRHAVGEPCLAIDNNGTNPAADECYWVWPDLNWAGGLGGAPDRGRIDAAAKRDD